MSELAFNLSGERFEPPAKAAGWRVRRLKPKGAPEVVYGRSGIPLILPIDADIEDLRQEARLEGRYRLDPVDEQGRSIETSSAGYVCVQPSDAEAAPVASRAATENPVIEAMRMNTELARTIIERFPMMIESAAVLLRAADGAGLPARPPRALPEPQEQPEDEDADEDDESDETPPTAEAPPRPAGWVSLVESLIPFIAPAIMNAVTSGKLSIPGGLGALFDCRRASAKPAAASAERAAGPRGVAPVPGPSDPAPARRAEPAATASRPRPSSPPAPPPAPSEAPDAATRGRVDEPAAAAPRVDEPPAGAPRPRSVVVEDASPRDVPLATAGGATSGAEERGDVDDNPADAQAATPGMDAVPTLDPAALAHFAAIQRALTLRESMLARALAAELTPADLRAWLTELRGMSVAEAVAKVRSLLGTVVGDVPGAASSTSSGGAR